MRNPRPVRIAIAALAGAAATALPARVEITATLPLRLALQAGQAVAQSASAVAPVTLGFHELHPTLTADQARSTGLPYGYQIYPTEPSSGAGDGPLVLRDDAVVRAEDLEDAQPSWDARTDQAVINFRLRRTAARMFARFSRENVGRPFAIVVDGKVVSAPVIRSEILGGVGQISGGFTVEAANARPLRNRQLVLSPASEAELSVIRAAYSAQQRSGAAIIPHYVISKAESVSDVLEVLLLGKETGLYVPAVGESPAQLSLDVVPLFPR